MKLLAAVWFSALAVGAWYAQLAPQSYHKLSGPELFAVGASVAAVGVLLDVIDRRRKSRKDETT